MRRLDDSGLVALINKQCEKGLDVMYRQYRGEFLNWGRSYFRTSDNHVLIDLYTDSCLSAYDNVRSGKYRLTENAGFKSYLFKIAVFKFKNRARGLANDPIANSVADFFEKFEKKINNADARTVPEMFPQYEKIVDDNEIDETRKHKVKIVREVVFCKMTEPCKSLLKYIYYDKLTGKDITALMPYKNTDTVKSQALRCRRKLAEVLNRKFKDEGLL